MLFRGVIQKGHGRATLLGFPTLNIPLTNVELSGVYIGRVWIGGVCYWSAVFADTARQILESHVLDFVGEVEGEIVVDVLKKIRNAETYTTNEELQEAITGDVNAVREYAQTHPIRVMIFGTYDGVHEGHRNALQQARMLSKNVYLIVSVARDEVVKRVKGMLPTQTEEVRAQALRAEPGVSEVLLGDREGYMAHIQKMYPDVIALGYDQRGEYVISLESNLKETGLSTHVVRLAPFRPEVYKSSMLNQKAPKYMGVDYGARRIGLALSDSEGRIAFPLDILDTKKESAKEVVTRAEKEGAGRIVVGDTRTLEGFSNTVTAHAEAFIAELVALSPVPIERVNEAYATNEALRFAPQGKKHDDSSAAAIILQRYLDMKVIKSELE